MLSNVELLDFIPIEQFKKIHYSAYLGLFFDAGYVSDDTQTYKKYNNNLVNSFLFSGGLGLNLVTYYDSVFRIEYSINHLGESGFFLHFDAPIR